MENAWTICETQTAPAKAGQHESISHPIYLLYNIPVTPWTPGNIRGGEDEHKPQLRRNTIIYISFQFYTITAKSNGSGRNQYTRSESGPI